MSKPRKDPRSPYYQYDFQIAGKRFHGSTYCASKRDAEQCITNLRRQILLGHGKPDITLDDACQSYWADKAQHQPSRATTEYQLANLCSIIGKDKMLSEIDIAVFRKFVAKRRGHGVSKSSVNREWQLARRVWNHVPDSFAKSVIKWGDLALPEPGERIKELTTSEQQRLFDKLPDGLKPIVECAILSGQRKSAVVGLRWDRINWEAGEATIINKGGREHRFPLSPELVDLILEQPELDGCDFVFTYVCERPSPSRPDRPARRKGVRYPFSQQGWDRKWRKAIKEAGLSDFRFHDLRHTSATRLMRNTGNLKATSRLLGHTDIRTTSRYAHVGMDDLRALMADTESRNIHGRRLTGNPETGSISKDKEDIA